MNDNILEISNLVVKYTSDGTTIHALNGINLNIKRGETVGLVGETGSGKTTIAKSILRILQMPPAKVCSGEIVFDGKNIMNITEKEMRKLRGDKIAMIFQDPMTALNPVQKVGDQISEAVALHNKVSRAEAIERAIDMLEMVGISAERYDEYPHQFSGGMKQRVVIAMALACNPVLLLADEPTTALDVTIQAQVLDMMNDLKNRFNTAVLMITHDLGIVAETCDSVAIIYAGEIVEYGDVVEIFDHTLHPYTQGLFDSLPRLNTKNRRLKPIKGLMPDPINLPSGCKFHDRCPYATENCVMQEPVYTKINEGHFVKCHRIKEGN